MARRIECRKCGTLNPAGDVCECSKPSRELLVNKLQKENMELDRKLQWFMENQNQIAMDVIRPVEEDNAKLRDALADMVLVAESQGWDNAEIHNAQDILSSVPHHPRQPGAETGNK
jgi:hypothetical protein